MVINSSVGAAAQPGFMPTRISGSAREANETARGPDNDGDRDDLGVVRASQSTPSINASGQTVGRIIDMSA